MKLYPATGYFAYNYFVNKPASAEAQELKKLEKEFDSTLDRYGRANRMLAAGGLDVPHRQVVFTMPKMLRIFFKFKRRLPGALCRCALRSLVRYFEILTESALTPGVIAAIQTFGDRINLHPRSPFSGDRRRDG